jgi:YD repeat-containing protein
LVIAGTSQTKPPRLGNQKQSLTPEVPYTYDAEGNLTGETQTSPRDVTTYWYDYRDRMTGATEKTSGGTVLMQATYVYDALDRRIETDETVGATEVKTWSVYDGTNVYAEFNGSGSLENRYLYGPAGDEILARTSAGGVTAWYLTDHLGSVRDVVSSAGMVLDHIVYDAYGNVTSQSNAADGDEFQYAGMRTDAATGWYYDKARWYSPVWEQSTEKVEFGPPSGGTGFVPGFNEDGTADFGSVPSIGPKTGWQKPTKKGGKNTRQIIAWIHFHSKLGPSAFECAKREHGVISPTAGNDPSTSPIDPTSTNQAIPGASNGPLPWIVVSETGIFQIGRRTVNGPPDRTSQRIGGSSFLDPIAPRLPSKK